MRWLLVGLVLVAGCDCSGASAVDAAMPVDGAVVPDATPPAVCGDGVAGPGEDCDDGPGNSDTEPGACRTSCRVAGCVDGVVDPAELCLPQPLYLTGDRPTSVAIGDLDRDGIPDMVVTNTAIEIDPFIGEVVVLRGALGGSFSVAERHWVGQWPSAVALGDLDGDDDLDVVVANQFTDDVSVLLNFGQALNGETRFDVGPTGYRPLALAIDDATGDELADVVVAGWGGVTLLAGNGAGGLGGAQTFSAGLQPSSVVLADVDDDDDLDLAVAASGDDTVAVLLGQPGGSFAGAQTHGVGDDPSVVVTGDFDEDGVTDLAVTDHGSDTVSVLLGTGGGDFAEATAVAVGVRPIGLVAGDVDVDGHQDLAVATTEGVATSVELLIGDGDGGFAAGQVVACPDFPIKLAAGDLDRDGGLDIVATLQQTDGVSVLFGTPSREYHDAEQLAVGATIQMGAGADVDADGDVDLVSGHLFDNEIRVVLNDGSGGFGTPIVTTVPETPTGLLVAELDGDEFVDAVVAFPDVDTVQVLIGAGDGTFTLGDTITVMRVEHLVLGDFDGDGTPDLAAAADQGFGGAVLIGNGDGTFTGTDTFGGVMAIGAMATADFDDDDDTELVIGDVFYQELYVLESNGDGTLADAVTEGTAIVDSIACWDADLDGALDIVAANQLYQGDGNGGFAAAVEFAPGRARGSAVADVNGDGVIDYLFNDDRVQLAVMLGTGDGEYADARYFVARGTSQTLVVDDLSGDGVVDAALWGLDWSILIAAP